MKRTFPWSKGEDDSSSDDGDGDGDGDSSSSAADSDAEENVAVKSKDKSSRVESGKLKKKGIDFEALSKHGYKGGLSVLKVPPPKNADDQKQDWSWSRGDDARGKEKEETYQDRQKTRATLLEAEQLEHARTQKEKNLSFSQKEKRKRDMGQASRGKNYVEEEKRLLRESGIYSGFDS